MTKKNVEKFINDDPQLKALRALLREQTDNAKIAEIEAFIGRRIKELNATLQG